MNTLRSLKIVYIGQKGIPVQLGGVERATEELAVRVARAGHRVVVYCRRWYTGKTPAQHEGVALVYVPSIHTKHLDAFSHSFFSLMHALWHGADIIHFQGIGPALLAWIPRIFLPRTKIFVTFHCLDRRLEKWNRAARAAFWIGEWVTMKCAHEVFATSRFLQSYCADVWGRFVVYLPNGVADDMQKDVSPECLKNFSVEPFSYVVCVGRLMRDKAQHEVVEAFKKLKMRTGTEFSELKLLFVGGCVGDDSYQTSLGAITTDRDDMLFVGTQSGENLKALMTFARCAVQPSHTEGMPIATLELAAYGVPLVLSDISAHREIFGNARMYYTSVGNCEEISEQLEKMLRDYEAAQILARTESIRILKDYRWELTAARYAVCLAERDFVQIQNGSVG